MSEDTKTEGSEIAQTGEEFQYTGDIPGLPKPGTIFKLDRSGSDYTLGDTVLASDGLIWTCTGIANAKFVEVPEPERCPWLYRYKIDGHKIRCNRYRGHASKHGHITKRNVEVLWLNKDGVKLRGGDGDG